VLSLFAHTPPQKLTKKQSPLVSPFTQPEGQSNQVLSKVFALVIFWVLLIRKTRVPWTFVDLTVKRKKKGSFIKAHLILLRESKQKRYCPQPKIGQLSPIPSLQVSLF